MLGYGEPRLLGKWTDYLSRGFTQEHILDPIRMALDPELLGLEGEQKGIWAPFHAVRALGQLRAQEAIEPLLALFHLYEDDGGSDWISEDLPDVYAMIGAAAIPALARYLLDETHDDFARLGAAASLRHIAMAHPDFRGECVESICAALEKFETNTATLNALLIDELLDLEAREALPLIERVHASGNVEHFGFANWDEIQVEFGLREPDPNKQRFIPPEMAALKEMLDRMDATAASLPDFSELDSDEPYVAPLSYRTNNKAKKAKRKQAEESRKINRKKRKR
jgi:hypothetical protein